MLINLEILQNLLQLSRFAQIQNFDLLKFSRSFCIKLFHFVFHPIKSLTTIKHTAPGNPNKPTTILVKIFNPIWKPKLAPIKLIIKMANPPKTELKTNFKIFFNGTIKILPKINKKQIQAKYVIRFPSILPSSIFYLKFLLHFYSFFGQILLYFNYPASSPSSNNENLISFIISTSIPLDFATFIK